MNNGVLKNGITIKNKLGDKHLFKISRFKEKIKRTKPHKHDGYYEIIYLQEGEGFHWIDTEKYAVNPPEIYFLKPGCLHCWQFTAIPKGFVVLFKESYFDLVKEAYLLELINQLNSKERLPFSEDFSPNFLLEEILKEYQNNSTFSRHIIHGYLRVHFSKLLEQTRAPYKDIKNAQLLYNQFLRMLEANNIKFKSVKDVAGALHVSPQYLNAICRKYSEKSAGQHLNDQLILEAKRYILHTEKTISEIAYLLDFSDPSYFVKFFKKHTRLTPGQFRRQYFQ